MASSYKTITDSDTVGEVISTSFGEIESLADEMTSWADSLEGTNLENSDKYSRIREAEDALANISEPVVPEEIEDKTVTYSIQIPKSKTKSTSRAVRLANVIGMLDAVGQLCYEFSAESDEDDDEAEDLANNIQSIIDEIEGVEFPGMFG